MLQAYSCKQGVNSSSLWSVPCLQSCSSKGICGRARAQDSNFQVSLCCQQSYDVLGGLRLLAMPVVGSSSGTLFDTDAPALLPVRRTPWACRPLPMWCVCLMLISFCW